MVGYRIVKIGLNGHIGNRNTIRNKIVGIGNEQGAGVVKKRWAGIADILRTESSITKHFHSKSSGGPYSSDHHIVRRFCREQGPGRQPAIYSPNYSQTLRNVRHKKYITGRRNRNRIQENVPDKDHAPYILDDGTATLAGGQRHGSCTWC